jgi:hypothetical protein
MTLSTQEPVIERLQGALEEIDHPEAQYHLRECLQLLEHDQTLEERKG